MTRQLAAWILLLTALATRSAAAQQPVHPIWDPATARWTPAGPGLASSTVLGDPDKPGSYAIAFRLAPGAWIPPHTHPAAKQVTVIAGALLMGYGERLDSAAVTPLKVGQVMVVPPVTAHYEGVKVATVVIFSGDGPLITNWVKLR